MSSQQPGGNAPDTLLAQIMAQTSDPLVQFSMIMGALLEGGNLTGPWSVGDQGTSFGPFQIHLPAHPGVTAQQAEDPRQAVAFMLPEYRAAAANVAPSAWASDPMDAAAQVVFHAERPAVMYPASRVQAAFGGAATALGLPSAVASGQPAGTQPGWFADAVAKAAHDAMTQAGQVEGAAGSGGGGFLAQLAGLAGFDPAALRTGVINLLVIILAGSMVLIGARGLVEGEGAGDAIKANARDAVGATKAVARTAAKAGEGAAVA